MFRYPTFPTLTLTLLAVLGCSDSEGAPPDPWADQRYLLEIPKTHWSEPPNIGNEIGDFVPQFVLEVGAVSGTTYDLLMGTAIEGEQDLCNPTKALQATSSAHPKFKLGPVDFPVHLVHATDDVVVNATIYELTIKNVLPDGETLAEEGVLTATMDMRELYPLFTLIPEPSPETVCSALESFEAPCEACPDDDEEYCLAIRAVQLGATEFTGAPLKVVKAGNVKSSCKDTGGSE